LHASLLNVGSNFEEASNRQVVVVGESDIIREVESGNSVEVVTRSAVVKFW
jgi:hypothetical protein